MDEEDIKFNVGFLSTKLTGSKTQGHQFIEHLCTSLPELIPQRFGNHEPLRHTFTDANAASSAWESMFFWKRSHPTSEGSVFIGSGRRHTSARFSCSVSPSVGTALAKYLTSASTMWSADYGYIHVNAHLENIYETQLAQTYLLGPATHELRRYLPDLCWGNVFGTPYVELFGKDRLLSAPAARVEEIAPSLIYLQITENPQDEVTDHLNYRALRSRIKAHLGSNAFYDPSRGESGSYRVPTFVLGPPPAPRPLGFIDGKPVTGLIAGRPIVQTDEGIRILDMKWTPTDLPPAS